MGEKRSISQIRKLEREGFDSSFMESEKEVEEMEPINRANESRMELDRWNR